VQVRPAGAATGGVGSRAITGGHTTTLILFACALATRSAILGTAGTCVPSTPLERELCIGHGVLGGG